MRFPTSCSALNDYFVVVLVRGDPSRRAVFVRFLVFANHSASPENGPGQQQRAGPYRNLVLHIDGGGVHHQHPGPQQLFPLGLQRGGVVVLVRGDPSRRAVFVRFFMMWMKKPHFKLFEKNS